MIRDAKKNILGKSIEDIIKKLANMSETLAYIPMLSKINKNDYFNHYGLLK